MSDSTTMTNMEDLLTETGSGDLDLSETSNVVYDEELDSPIIGQQYLAKFHPLTDYETEYEERESSVVSGVHFNTAREMQVYLDDGYVKISVEEQNALVDGGVRRIADGAIVERPPVIVPFASKQAALLAKIDTYSAKRYVGGFYYNVTSGVLLGWGYFDSSEEDQQNFSTMYAATQSPNFESHPVYQGFIPMRGRVVTDKGLETEVIAEDKSMYYLNKENMQLFMDAFAEHVGYVKTEGWNLQNMVNGATEETWDQVEAQVLAIIGEETTSTEE